MDNAIVQTAQDDTQQDQPKKPGAIKRFFAFINRGPWTLLYPVVFALVALGGWWLINHPQVITEYVVSQPYALYAVLAVFGAWLAGWLTIKFFATISRWLAATWQATTKARKEDPIAWFFWVTIYGLLAVSVLGSGAFFEKHFPHPVVGVGYAIALMFDLVTINAMRARLEALRTGDKSISWLYLLAIFICTSATIFGNVYSALDYVHGVPQEMVDVAPWLAVIFPSMIIVMSVLADHLLEKTSTRLDAQTFRNKEQQRLDILIARREMREKMKLEEEKLAQLDMKPKKERRTFFLFALLFPRDGVDAQAVVEQTVETMKPQLETLAKQNQELNQRLLSFVQGAQNAHAQLASLVEKQTRQVADIDAQRDVDNGLMMEQIRLSQKGILDTLKGQINDAMSTVLSMEKEALQEYLKEALMDLDITIDKGQDKASVSSTQTPTYHPSYEEDKSEDVQGDNQQDDSELAFVLTNYPIVKRWLSESQKSLTLEEVEIGTGHSRKMVLNRHKDKTLVRTKNPLKVTTMSVVEWLKTAPLPKSKTASKEENNRPDNNGVIEDDMVPETPALSDPDTGEFEAIMKGRESEYNLEEVEGMAS